MNVMVMTMMGRVWRVCVAVLCMAASGGLRAQTLQPVNHDVVINEIHYDPDIKTEWVEFVELYNAGSSDVNLVGWRLCDAVDYVFPEGAVLAAHGYVVVAQDWTYLITKWPQAMVSASDYDVVHGPFEGRLGNDGQTITLCDADLRLVDQVAYDRGFPWPTVGDPLEASSPGTGASIQLVHSALDNGLAGSWRSALPTPGARNAKVYSTQSPPDVEDVAHSPFRPATGDVVTITAKVADPDGVRIVTCFYQKVDPGQYVGLRDAGYAVNWTALTMVDNGLGPDAKAGDGAYTVQMPASVQAHRRLVRYRITATDSRGLSVTVPYADDPQPNFAYFVYDGVPAWQGAVNPNGALPVNEVVEYPQQVMSSLPVYHLISKKTDVETATWLEKYGGGDYKWWGTLVYDGKVYDHIRYRARGGVWRYAMGKNMWKFDFNRGHEFQAKDDYGRPYKTRWNKLNLGACIQQGSFGQRGEQGMFEALSFKMFNQVGVPASRTHWLQFRIIDETYEDGMLNAAHRPLTATGTQYDGDLWGLYLAVEQLDGRFLDEHGLPDGNLYKMELQYGELNNQGPTAVDDGSDIRAFKNTYESNPPDLWWGSNVNLESYYGLYAVYNAVHHGDITSKNNFFYLNPEPTTNSWGTHNLWWQLPWDLDLTWTTYYGSMSDPFSRAGVLGHTLFGTQARNRVREVCDLLFNADQMSQMIDGYAAIMDDPSGGLSIVDVDRAMWDWHWVMGSGAYPQYINQPASVKAGQDMFYQSAQKAGLDRSFEGMVQSMKNYAAARLSYMNGLCSDSAIPVTPVVTATCGPSFPMDGLTFSVNAFSDPQGAQTFAALQWRIAEVEPFSQFKPTTPAAGTVLLDSQQTWRCFKGKTAPSSDPAAWRQIGFNDAPSRSAWIEGTSPIGYGETFIQTVLNDMQGNYSTVYLRKTFQVTDPCTIGSLQLEARYDDGFVAWINGVAVASENVLGTDLAYNALAPVSKEASDFVVFPIANPKAVLKAGENILAVHLVNVSLAGSSDACFDARLVAKLNTQQDGSDGTLAVVQGRPGHFEIEAAWQGDLVPAFDSRVRIPAGVVEAGGTYRVRCRMEDNTGRWSHWSDPVQFVAGPALSGQPSVSLQITEIMFNPADTSGQDGWDADNYEFIELMNTGSSPIELSGVRLTDGVEFDFKDSRLSHLGPGEFTLVVSHPVAFECRYGQTIASRIAGQYAGRLSNGGERIRLVDLQAGVLADLDYEDGWYGSTDGLGMSLVPVDLSHVTASQLGQKTFWRASAHWGGSPGSADSP